AGLDCAFKDQTRIANSPKEAQVVAHVPDCHAHWDDLPTCAMWVTIGPRADDSMIRKHSPGWTPCIMCGADVLHGPEHVWNYLPDQEAESSEGQSTLLCQTVGLVSRGYTHNILGTSSIHLFHSLSFGMSKPSTYVSVDLGKLASRPYA
ncbi:hypothetical protein T06_5715, partial [Trichinella sp. T6]